jgi:hypothetical protein
LASLWLGKIDETIKDEIILPALFSKELMYDLFDSRNFKMKNKNNINILKF